MNIFDQNGRINYYYYNYFSFSLIEKVTRNKKRLFDRFGIRPCYVRIDQDIQADCIGWLERPQRLVNRRTSVAGGCLFSVDDDIQEAGFDHFIPIPRNDKPILGKISKYKISW